MYFVIFCFAFFFGFFPPSSFSNNYRAIFIFSIENKTTHLDLRAGISFPALYGLLQNEQKQKQKQKKVVVEFFKEKKV
jgi:hypothetical protein